jgi:hypothetical protein
MRASPVRYDQQRRAEARDLPALVYGRFTEGFGTPDLKDARVLGVSLRMDRSACSVGGE